MLKSILNKYTFTSSQGVAEYVADSERPVKVNLHKALKTFTTFTLRQILLYKIRQT